MSPGHRHYLDHNATAPIRPEAADAVLRALALPGNPSSVHAEGRAARAVLERAREQVAALCGADAAGVIFTSGGSEAAATVLSPGLRAAGRPPATLLLIGATEHVCVRDGHRFPKTDVDTIPVDAAGLLDLGWLGARLARHAAERLAGGTLVSVHLANNETGVIQPLAAIAALVRAHGGLLHSDAVQAAGRIPLDVAALGADVLTLSAHKLGGPKGVGAIVLGGRGLELTQRLVAGGGQERGWRAGTENVAGIAGFGAAAAVACSALAAEHGRLASLRDRLEQGVRALAHDSVFFGAGAARLPNTSAFATPGVRAETALIRLDLSGIAVSSGSACSSGKVRRSHVLDAMGVAPRLAEGALRVSLGWTTTDADIDAFLAAYAPIAAAPAGERRAAA